MTNIVRVKTGSKFEKIGGYSRAVVVENWIYLSNTAGRNPDTKEMPTNAIEQTDQVFTNIEMALSAVDATLNDVVRARIFIQHHEKINEIMAHIGTKFRGIDPAMTITCPPLGSPSYEVEIEVTAYRDAAKADVERINI